MRDGSFYDELLELNKQVYHNPKKDYKNWLYQGEAYSKDGLFIALYSNGKETAFVIRGTEDLEDLKTDLRMKLHQYNSQFDSAFIYYCKIRAKNPNLIFTGHSLGGSIAQYLGTLTGIETITFEAYGIADNYRTKHTNNIINFGNLCDPVFILNYQNHIGKCLIMPIKATEKSFKWHLLENCGKPSQAKEISLNPSDGFINDFGKPLVKDAVKKIRK